MGGGDKGLKMYGFVLSLLFFLVSFSDTLYCVNISVILVVFCNKVYSGCLMDIMVCVGVEGGGTNFCEVRVRGLCSEGRRSGEGNRCWSWDGVAFCLFGVGEDSTGRFGDGESRVVRMGVRLELGLETVIGVGCVRGVECCLVWDGAGWCGEGERVWFDVRWEMC